MSNYHSEVGGHNDIIFIFIKYHDLKEIHFNFKNYKFDTITLRGLTPNERSSKIIARGVFVCKKKIYVFTRVFAN